MSKINHSLKKRVISHIALIIITSWVFEALALIVIIANSIVLALDDPKVTTTTPT